jgi:hypothetical protein
MSVFKKRVQFEGTIYACPSTHLGNSNVLFRVDNLTARVIPGRIHYIFTQGEKTFFGIHRLLDKEETFDDPFAPYKDFPAKVFSTRYAEELDIVDGKNLVSHFARYSLSANHSAVVSLGKTGNVWNT